ncbi:hypothetical protein U8607_10790 [Methylobacterium durans]|uniref:hypothetical protein n=1 Tax=Methylobacterium durans TaxID=2202825 RepID=UPI002AFF13FB|nr:hypothetical protein [Methylobacterium durans]MEA1832567.1 hypothetical protein [Methylobacterium durans]
MPRWSAHEGSQLSLSEPAEATKALRNWRNWVADGRAKLQWGALVIPVRELTVEESEAEAAKYREEPVH